MSVRKHCRGLLMITVRMTRAEREKLRLEAAQARLPLNTYCRRRLGLPDHAQDESAKTESPSCYDDASRQAVRSAIATPPKQQVYLVLARNRREAQDWAIAKGMIGLPGRSAGWLYASSSLAIQGARDCIVVWLDGFECHPESCSIVMVAQDLISRGLAREEIAER